MHNTHSHYAKNKCNPLLTDKAREHITKEYVALRAERRPKVITITLYIIFIY